LDTHDSVSIMFQLKKVMKLMHKRHINNLGVGKLSHSQWLIVRNLMENEKRTIGELSSALMVTNATISGHVDKLVKKTVVKRTRSEDDRRIVYVEIEKDFAVKLKCEHHGMKGSFDDLFSDLTKEQEKKILEGLTILEEVLVGGKDDEVN